MEARLAGVLSRRLLDSQIADLLATATSWSFPLSAAKFLVWSLLKICFVESYSGLRSRRLVEVLGDAGARSKPEIPPTWLVKSFNFSMIRCLQRLGIAAHQRVRDFFVLSRMIEGHAQIYRRLARTGPRDDSYNDQQWSS